MKLWPFGSRSKARQDLTVAASVGVGFDMTPKWPEDNYENFAREGYGRNEVVFACIDAIATSASEAPPRVMALGGKEPEAVESGPLVDLLNRPNPRQTGFELIETGLTYLQIAGNAYLYKLRDGRGKPISVQWLRPDRMQVVPGPDGVAGYIYTLDGQDYACAAEDVGHLKLPNPWSDWYGQAPLHVLARRVNLDAGMTNFQKQFFSNAGIPAGILNIKRRLNDEQDAETIRRHWRARFSGGNTHNLAILDEDSSYQQLAVDPDRLAMVDLTGITEARIASVFGVPLSLIASQLGQSSSSYANRLSDREMFWEQKLLPLYRRLSDFLTMTLVPEYGDPNKIRIDFDFDQVRALQDDEDKKSARVVAEWTGGLITRDEARAKLGYDPALERGVVFRIPINVEEVGPDAPEPEPLPEPTAPQLPSGRATAQTEGLPQLPVGAPQKALSEPTTKDLTAHEEHLSALLQARREPVERRAVSETERYFARLRQRVDGVMGRHMTAEVTTKEEGLPFTADQLISAKDDADIQRTYRDLHLLAAEAAWNAINDSGLLDVEVWDSGSPPVQRLLAEGATRVVGINDSTRSALREMLQVGVSRGYSIAQIAAGVADDEYAGVRSLVSELYRNRAQTIARTEIGTAQAGATAARYAASGVTEVRVMDGDHDAPCSGVNGTTQTVEWYAANPLAHPNCIRAAYPVIEGLTTQERGGEVVAA